MKKANIELIAEYLVNSDKEFLTLPIYDINESGDKVVNRQKLLEFANQFQTSGYAADVRQETSLLEEFNTTVSEELSSASSILEIFDMAKKIIYQ